MVSDIGYDLVEVYIPLRHWQHSMYCQSASLCLMLSAALTVQVWRGCSVVLAVGLHGLYITMVDVVNVMYVVPRITSTTSAEHGGHRHWHGCVSTGIKYSVWYHTFCMTYL